jgi:hypothetical protein
VPTGTDPIGGLAAGITPAGGNGIPAVLPGAAGIEPVLRVTAEGAAGVPLTNVDGGLGADDAAGTGGGTAGAALTGGGTGTGEGSDPDFDALTGSGGGLAPGTGGGVAFATGAGTVGAGMAGGVTIWGGPGMVGGLDWIGGGGRPPDLGCAPPSRNLARASAGLEAEGALEVAVRNGCGGIETGIWGIAGG